MDGGRLVGATIGPYRVETLIGRGGMGEVYRAYDSTLGRQVALKVLPPAILGNEEALARFVREARSASALNHPNVVSIYQIGREVPVSSGSPAPDSAVHYIAMELVSGETLRTLIETRRLDLKRALDHLAQAADALAAAHAAGVVHRDFKPDNVMVAEAGYVKVLDFGLAKARADALLEHADTQHTAMGTESGVILGTVGYMSPEQAEGRKVDYRADIFSFGCVAYEAATGTRAFRGRSSIDTLHQIVHVEPEPLTVKVPDAPVELQRIVRKCLAKDPDQRYQSMKDVAIDLRTLRRELDSSSSISTAAATVGTATPSRRGALPWIAIAAAVLIALAAVVWLNRSPHEATVTSVGEPLRVQRLTGSGNVIDAVISPDGRYLAYVESLGGEQSLWLRQFTSTQPLQLVPAARVGYWGMRFAPDSSSIYYTLRGPQSPSGALYEIPLLGGTARMVLNGVYSSASWSPDGRRMVFLRENSPEPGASAVMVANRDGSDVRALVVKRPPLFVAPGFFVAPSWSPDGARISIGERNSETREARLITVDAANGSEQAFPTSFSTIGYTHWLPDGSGIAFVAPPPEATTIIGTNQVWIQPYPAGVPQRLTTDVVDYRNVTISADGRQLVTVGADLAPTLWRVPLDGSDPQRIPSVRADGVEGVSTMPDGRIVFTTVSGPAMQLAVMRPDGTDRRVFTFDGTAAYPRVTADGGTIVFSARRGQTRGIWRMTADGSDVRLVAEFPDPTNLVISPDAQTVYFTSTRDGAPSTWKVALPEGAPALVKAGLDRVSVSPDGQWLAGVTYGNLGLSVLRTTDYVVVRSFSRQPLASQSGVLLWTADSQGIMYTTAERSNLWLQKLSGGEPSRVTNFTDQTIFRAELTRDGRSVVVARGQQVRDAFLITNFRRAGIAPP